MLKSLFQTQAFVFWVVREDLNQPATGHSLLGERRLACLVAGRHILANHGSTDVVLVARSETMETVSAWILLPLLRSSPSDKLRLVLQQLTVFYRNSNVSQVRNVGHRIEEVG